MRIVRSVILLVVGLTAGFAAAAAMLRGVLPSRGGAESDELALVTIFDGIEIASRATAFRGGSILAWFGGVSLDLRGATLAPGARLEIRAAFGGVAVRVPASWRIEAETRAIAGGVEAPPADIDDPAAPALTVSALTVFGGVSIRR